jgi:hypothetical protein
MSGGPRIRASRSQSRRSRSGALLTAELRGENSTVNSDSGVARVDEARADFLAAGSQAGVTVSGRRQRIDRADKLIRRAALLVSALGPSERRVGWLLEDCANLLRSGAEDLHNKSGDSTPLRIV